MNKIVHAKFRALICTPENMIATYPVITGKVVKLGNISKCISIYKVCFLNIWKI